LQTEWSEGHSYDDPARSSAPLRGWFLEMIGSFPAMNGPFAPAGDPIDDEYVTDYSVGTSVMYAAFAWSVAQKARARVLELAKKHGVGFFDASSADGYTWRPGDPG